ncbi:MAG: hypothetical protein U0871_22905 [Gemmataceae bacterium]
MTVTGRGPDPDPREWSAAQLAAGQTRGLLGRFGGVVVEVVRPPDPRRSPPSATAPGCSRRSSRPATRPTACRPARGWP